MSRRRTPYTVIGIRRLLCWRCRKRRGTQQWQICADGNTWRPLCDRCDIALNAAVLRFMGVTDWRRKIATYRLRFSA